MIRVTKVGKAYTGHWKLLGSSLQCLFLASLILFQFGCSQKKSPEDTLKNFIELRFKKGVSIDQLLLLIEGDMKEEYVASQAEIGESLKNPLYFKYLKIRSVDNDGSHASIVYTLGYYDSKAKNNLITVKKIAQLSNFDGDWRIVDIHNVKTNISIKEKLEIHE